MLAQYEEEQDKKNKFMPMDEENDPVQEKKKPTR